MLAGSGEEHYLRVLQLRLPWRALYTTFRLDAEVRNGGLHQYFWNTEGLLNTATDEDPGYIGASGIQRFFVAMLLVSSSSTLPHRSVAERIHGRSLPLGYKAIPWDSLDAEFYETSPTLFQQVARYVREHQDEYDRNA
jgi:hypothetical protein